MFDLLVFTFQVKHSSLCKSTLKIIPKDISVSKKQTDKMVSYFNCRRLFILFSEQKI